MWSVELGIVQVNCSAVVHLTRLYLPGMVERRSGDILIVSSTAAYQAVPYMATYAASKAFDLLFAEALAREVERYGVRVCALCPGPDGVGVPAGRGCAGRDRGQHGTGGPRGAGWVARAGGEENTRSFRIRELGRSGDPTDRSAAIGHVRRRDPVSSSGPTLTAALPLRISQVAKRRDSKLQNKRRRSPGLQKAKALSAAIAYAYERKNELLKAAELRGMLGRRGPHHSFITATILYDPWVDPLRPLQHGSAELQQHRTAKRS